MYDMLSLVELAHKDQMNMGQENTSSEPKEIVVSPNPVSLDVVCLAHHDSTPHHIKHRKQRQRNDD